MALAHPAPDRAGDDRQHGVVDRRAVERLGGVVQRLQRDRREGDLAARADPPVKRRAALAARVLATQEARQMRAAARLVGGVRGVRLRGVMLASAPSSHSSARA